jgi:hypothetical protein
VESSRDNRHKKTLACKQGEFSGSKSGQVLTVYLGLVALTNADVHSAELPGTGLSLDRFDILHKLNRLLTDRTGHAVGFF